MRRSLGALAVVAALLVPVRTRSLCTERADLAQLSEAIRDHFRCVERRLMGPARACAPPSLPACAGEALAELGDLLTGGVRRTADAAASRCQLAIVRAGHRFARRRLRELSAGHRPARALRRLRPIGPWCRDVRAVAGPDGVVPRLGGACSGVGPAAGETVDAPSLARCERAAIERILTTTALPPLRPNIVVVLTDDQRADTLRWLPELREIAASGLSFDQAFAETAACAPSRASILTGLHTRHHGVISNGDILELDPSRTLAVALSAAGYRTALFGKYLNLAERLGGAVPLGWSVFQVFESGAGGGYDDFTLVENGVRRHYGPRAYSTDLLRERVIDFIRRNAERPFFVLFAPFAPHEPATPAPRHEGAFAPLPPWRPPSFHEPDLSLKPRWVHTFAFFSKPEVTERRDALRRRELESLLAVEEAVVRIRDVLENLGLADETVLVLTSDHGIQWGEHWTGTKFAAYEESARIPFSLRYPARFPVPEVRHELVSTIDLAPTLAELAGASMPLPVDGRSLVGRLEGAASWRSDLLIHNTGGFFTKPNVAVRTDRWKYIRTRDSVGITEELYDLAADPFELSNRAFDPAYAAVRADLARRLDALLADGDTAAGAGPGRASSSDGRERRDPRPALRTGATSERATAAASRGP